MKKIIFRLTGMDCTSCAFNIDGELEDLNGVKEAKTNYAKQLTEVTFDPKKVTLSDIIQTVQKIDKSYTVEVQQ